MRAGAAIAVAVAVGLILWLVLKGDGNGGSKNASVPVAASVPQLRALPGSLGHPVYWVGPRGGDTYELTRTPHGNVYIRYLPPGVAVGSRNPRYTTVGTYPVANAYQLMKTASRRNGAITRRVAHGGLAVSTRGSAKSTYFAYPGSDLLIEVYDPSPARARGLVFSGTVRPVR